MAVSMPPSRQPSDSRQPFRDQHLLLQVFLLLQLTHHAAKGITQLSDLVATPGQVCEARHLKLAWHMAHGLGQGEQGRARSPRPNP
jgi:hypothetical protein